MKSVTRVAGPCSVELIDAVFERKSASLWYLLLLVPNS